MVCEVKSTQNKLERLHRRMEFNCLQSVKVVFDHSLICVNTDSIESVIIFRGWLGIYSLLAS